MYLKHSECGRHYYISPYLYKKRTKLNQETCIFCNPKGNHSFSLAEKRMISMVGELSKHPITPNFSVGRLNIDCYVPALKLGFELYGDSIHGNPKKYFSNETVVVNNKRFSVAALWKKNSAREYTIRKNGIKLVIIWESDMKKKEEDIKKFIQYYLER